MCKILQVVGLSYIDVIETYQNCLFILKIKVAYVMDEGDKSTRQSTIKLHVAL